MRFTMTRTLLGLCLILLSAIAFSQFASADYPKPSPYPIAWQFQFQHDVPKRVVVDTGKDAPVAYYYMTYTVTNNTGEERTFLPLFELLTSDGRVIRSDQNIPRKVFDAIKEREKKQFLEPWTKIGGELRLGDDQARDGVAIWAEPAARMGKFNIFVGGLSGEAVHLKNDKGEDLKDKEGNPIILRKTLQLDFHIRGDEVYRGEDPVDPSPETWIMR